MKTTEFDFTFPEELVAQEPLPNRDDSKLLVVNRANNEFVHSKIKNIVDYFNEGDLLVVNNSKVLPSRIFGKRDSGGEHEILLINKTASHKDSQTNQWEAISNHLKRIKEGSVFYFKNNLQAICIQNKAGKILLNFNQAGEEFYKTLYEIGEMPLPPYIKRNANSEDVNRYQTVYAKNPGSAAAPTAGFHFTEDLIKKIKDKQIKFAEITLHVSLDTFMPVREDEIEMHEIHGEQISISKETSDLINKTRDSGSRVIAVGTTSVRAIESSFENGGGCQPCQKNTKLFITPGYEFKLVDAMVTNFHRPKSTLLALVSAFASYDLIMSAYKTAVNNNYRLFSYGDSMFII